MTGSHWQASGQRESCGDGKVALYQGNSGLVPSEPSYQLSALLVAAFHFCRVSSLGCRCRDVVALRRIVGGTCS